MAPTSANLLDVIPMAPTMGACLIGVYLSCIFYGLTLLQTYQYFHRYWARDKMYLYVLVTVLTVLDTVATVANMYSMWHYLIENYGDPVTILPVHWTISLSLAATLGIEFLVKSFYGYRLWICGALNGIHTILFALVTVGVGIAYIYLIAKNGSLFYLPKITHLVVTALVFSLGADILIASSITFLLMKGRNNTSQTDDILRKLITYTINTGLLTVICTLMTLILAQAYSHTFYDTIFYFPLSKCYVNSALAFLNTRDSLRADGDMEPDHSAVQSSKLEIYHSSQDFTTFDIGRSKIGAIAPMNSIIPLLKF
ncbi:hypothetical protein NLJ89_g8830 [Agrocybe chaxingu]|uniref:DUF6534 domain-containing protein n=1 Tax=Agrocybe chaxingu TaxID=84603 RepID=A0A9W8MU47_9AGAR|nr:hypothetical protein NLJ89_g8830 [Agrocybe chaxingu]